MDYEKKYKEALERAKKYYNERITLGHTRDVIKEIFPEVKDDENERIKNSLIRWFKNCDSPYFAGFELSKIVDWLEKQGEQKPFDYENANIQQKDFAPQQKWSEEDENMANNLIEGFLSSVSPYHLTHTSQEIADWLKSLKDRMKGKED